MLGPPRRQQSPAVGDDPSDSRKWPKDEAATGKKTVRRIVRRRVGSQLGCAQAPLQFPETDSVLTAPLAHTSHCRPPKAATEVVPICREKKRNIPTLACMRNVRPGTSTFSLAAAISFSATTAAIEGSSISAANTTNSSPRFWRQVVVAEHTR